MIMNTNTKNTTGIGWVVDNAVAAGLSREEQRRTLGIIFQRGVLAGEKAAPKGKGHCCTGLRNFRGNISLTISRLILRYELLLVT